VKNVNDLISSSAFREAAEAGALSTPILVGVDGGYVLEATFGTTPKYLSAKSKSGEHSRRVFASLQSASSFLRDKAGITSFAVNTAGYRTAAAPARYAGAAERLRKAHAAARSLVS
jgi:hypothetical protein